MVLAASRQRYVLLRMGASPRLQSVVVQLLLRFLCTVARHNIDVSKAGCLLKGVHPRVQRRHDARVHGQLRVLDMIAVCFLIEYADQLCRIVYAVFGVDQHQIALRNTSRLHLKLHPVSLRRLRRCFGGRLRSRGFLFRPGGDDADDHYDRRGKHEQEPEQRRYLIFLLFSSSVLNLCHIITSSCHALS